MNSSPVSQQEVVLFLYLTLRSPYVIFLFFLHNCHLNLRELYKKYNELLINKAVH